MGKSIRDRAGNRSDKGFSEDRERGNYDDPWEREFQERDPSRDVRDIYEDQPGSTGDEYVWPENEDEDED
ncbi:MAG: hypothetical protein WAU64_03445 [Methanoregula sp.]|uniref:hypothetical protein n=1 Tax=Methanoregula sp. TaxID=2052170 RepID=UPI003BB0DD98